MDEGVIYEEGTPQQIFENPQKDKTRAFIHHTKTFVFEIRSRSFDLYSLNAGIETFGARQFLLEKQIYDIQLILEELLIDKLFPMQKDAVDIAVSVGRSEESSAIAPYHYLCG